MPPSPLLKATEYTDEVQGCKSLFEVGGLFYGRKAISSFSGGAYAVFSCF